jgi:uncharacterized repeat protein (TIGR03806 family)
VTARALLAITTLVAACNGGSPPSPPTTPDAAAPDAAPPAPRFGISQRPANTTCVAPAPGSTPARLLSETGCADPKDPKRPAPGLIPYDVASPLWSDGAEKQRFIALPDGARIRATDAEHWELPSGAVLVKSFLIGGRFVETRLLARVNEFTWKGYSYEWNAAQTDAVLLEDAEGGHKKEVPSGAGTQLWHFPSRAQCLQCHTMAAGVSLGPSATQLDFDHRYPSGITSNQVSTLEHIGLFEAPPARAGALPAPAGGGPLDERVRSYLHVNCANCHRPGGSFEGIDLRYTTPFERTGLCNQPPEKGDLGVPGALRLVPGDPGRSLLALRMKTLQEGRMPQIGTSVVDAAGVALVEQWIRSVTCP